jgi:hypothetical protein
MNHGPETLGAGASMSTLGRIPGRAGQDGGHRPRRPGLDPAEWGV